jgi:uncharacterized membrane protein YccF (DUF307 family)
MKMAHDVVSCWHIGLGSLWPHGNQAVTKTALFATAKDYGSDDSDSKYLINFR